MGRKSLEYINFCGAQNTDNNYFFTSVYANCGNTAVGDGHL